MQTPSTAKLSSESLVPDDSAVDRRLMLTQAAAGLGGLLLGTFALRAAGQGFEKAIPKPLPIPVPNCPPLDPSVLPAHLTSTDPWDPNSFAVNSWYLSRALGADCFEVMLGEFEKFLVANKASLQTSTVVVAINSAYNSGSMPTTIAGLTALAVNALSPQGGSGGVAQSSAAGGGRAATGSLCIEGPESSCIDTGCSSIPGTCWSVPALIQELGLEPCECVRTPKWYECALLILMLALLVLTPGPDEIPATLAAIGRLVVRVAPAA